jgi:hypothetical protein
MNKRKEDAEGSELIQGERKLADEMYGGSDKSEKKAEDVIQCESEMNHHDMVRGMLNGIVDTVVQGVLFP